MNEFSRSLYSTIAFVLLFSASLLAQSKGKIDGKVTDESGEPLPGVQVFIDGTTRGTLSEGDGYYSIINVTPGEYTLVFKYLGFSDVRVQNVEVIIDRTTEINMVMKEAVIEGEEVVVISERPVVQPDRTTTTSFVSSKEIEDLPVQSVADVVNLQAGVVEGHFRGGRTNEVAYVVNGVPINNAFSNTAGFEVEQNMVSSLEVISGVFNAEYGQALSGVVNIVTKDVPREWSFNSQSFVRSVVSGREFLFLDRNSGPGSNLSVDDFQTNAVTMSQAASFPNQVDVQFSGGGPIIEDKLGIQFTGRFNNDRGSTWGRDLFQPSDSSSFLLSAPRGGYTDPNNPQNDWIIESTGDGDFVDMTEFTRYSINASLTYNMTSSTKLDYNLFAQTQEAFSFDGGFNETRRYNPDSRNVNSSLNQTHIVGLRHSFSSKTFGNLSYSYLRSSFNSQLYDDPLDPRLVQPLLSQQTGPNAFPIGGNDLSYTDNLTQTHTIVGSVTSQVDRYNQVKAGFNIRLHDINSQSRSILAVPGQDPIFSPTRNPGLGFRDLQVNPYEFAAYIQDKIELDNMIINAGLRFDMFDPAFDVPRFWYLADQETIINPDNPTDPTDLISNRRAASIKTQVSPRIGVAFPVSATGVIRFSYGMFFQTPALSGIYNNNEYFIDEGATSASFGNPDIDPQQTSSFEIGLQQGLTDDLGLEVTLFTRDIRNLGATVIEDSPIGVVVSRTENLDYGTVRGFTLSLFQRPRGRVQWNLDYTFQFVDGSAFISGDSQIRNRAGLDDVVVLARLPWDRRHVLNNVITVQPIRPLSITLVNRLNSGRPYTTERFRIRSFLPNNEDRPTTVLTDLRAFYNLPLKGTQLIFQVQNLFDVLAPQFVFDDSGRADYTLDEFDAQNQALIGVNTLDDWFERQSFYSAPRRVALGLSIRF
ncbi:MAG: TonB-dependent receptor [Bacteroidota bacterium]